jgi:hypothetical protein
MRRSGAAVAMQCRRGPAGNGGDMADGDTTQAHLRRTPLHALHVALGARMVPFAGWDMPVQYPMGVLREHLARAQARACSTSATWGR